MACALAISLTVSYAISSSALVRFGDDTVEPVQREASRLSLASRMSYPKARTDQSLVYSGFDRGGRPELTSVLRRQPVDRDSEPGLRRFIDCHH